MFNYLKAEMYRVFKKKSFYIVLILAGLIYGVMNFFMNNDSYNAEKLVENTVMLLQSGIIVIGIYVFTTIYNDDFNSKSMQASIGYGIERNKLVIFKILAAILLSITIFAVLTGIFLINLKVLGFSLNYEEIRTIVGTVVGEIVYIVAICSIAGIFSFFSQKGVPGTVVFVIIISQVLDILLYQLLSLDTVVSIIGNRTEMILTNEVSRLQTVIATGDFEIFPIAMILGYILGGMVITIITFRNRELEF